MSPWTKSTNYAETRAGIVFIRPEESDGLDGFRRAGGPWGRRARSGLSCESTRTTSRSPSRTSCSGSRKANGNIRTSTCSSTATSTRFARGRRRKLGRSQKPSKAARRPSRPKPFGRAPHSATHGGQEADESGSHLCPDRTFGPREDKDDHGPRRRLQAHLIPGADLGPLRHRPREHDDGPEVHGFLWRGGRPHPGGLEERGAGHGGVPPRRPPPDDRRGRLP